MKNVYINGKIYPESECVFVNGSYRHISESNVCRDFYTNRPIYMPHSSYGTDEKGNIHYTMVKDAIILTEDGKCFISHIAAEKAGYEEDIYSGKFGKELTKSKSPKVYRLRGFCWIFPEIIPSQTFLKTLGKQYKFGIEIETSIGRVPDYLYTELPIKCVFDGSLRNSDGNDPTGGEYVTSILQGDTGLLYLNRICHELSKRCRIDNRCSVHVHLSTDFTKETTVALYALCEILEKEIFSIIPKSRQNNPYCKYMKHVEIDYSKLNNGVYVRHIYTILQDIIACHQPHKGKKGNHPLGYHCRYDKETPRYWWVNFVPTMFDIRENQNYTIEFRSHSATLNYFKIKNWLLICMAILDVAENHRNEINQSINLQRILELSYGKNSKNLIQYIEMRKKLFEVSGDNVEYVKKNNTNVILNRREL